MSDNELILAISSLFDKKLKPVHEKLTELETRLGSVEDMLGDNILPRLMRIEETQMSVVLPKLKKIELTLENDMVPRVRNIEACYLETFRRYQQGNYAAT